MIKIKTSPQPSPKEREELHLAIFMINNQVVIPFENKFGFLFPLLICVLFSSCGAGPFNIINNSSDTLSLILINNSDSIYVGYPFVKIPKPLSSMSDTLVIIKGKMYYTPCGIGDRIFSICPSDTFISSVQSCGDCSSDIIYNFPSDIVILRQKGQIIYHQRRDSLKAELTRQAKVYENGWWYRHVPYLFTRDPYVKFFYKNIDVEVKDKTVEVR